MAETNPFSSTGEPMYPPGPLIGQKDAFKEIRRIVDKTLKDSKGTSPDRAIILANYGHGKSHVALRACYDINRKAGFVSGLGTDLRYLGVTFSSQQIRRGIDELEGTVLDGFAFVLAKKLSGNDPTYPAPYMKSQQELKQEASTFFDFDSSFSASQLIEFIAKNSIRRLFVFWDELEDVGQFEEQLEIYNTFLKNWGDYSSTWRFITLFFLCTWEGQRAIASKDVAGFQRPTPIYLLPFNRSMAWELLVSATAAEGLPVDLVSPGNLQSIYSACLEHVGARLAQGRAMVKYLNILFDLLLEDKQPRKACLHDIERTLTTKLGYIQGLDKTHLRRIIEEFSKKAEIRDFEGDSRLPVKTILFDQQPRTYDEIRMLLRNQGLSEEDSARATEILLDERFSSAGDSTLLVETRMISDEAVMQDKLSEFEEIESVVGIRTGRKHIYNIVVDELLSSLSWVRETRKVYFVPNAEEITTLYGVPRSQSETLERTLRSACNMNIKFFVPSIQLIQSVFGVSFLTSFLKREKKVEIEKEFEDATLDRRLSSIVRFLEKHSAVIK